MNEATKFGYSAVNESPNKKELTDLSREEKEWVNQLSVTIKQDLQSYLVAKQEGFYTKHRHTKQEYIIASIGQALNLTHGVKTGIDLSKFSKEDLKLINDMAENLRKELLTKDVLDSITNYADQPTQDKIVKATLIQSLKDLGHTI